MPAGGILVGAAIIFIIMITKRRCCLDLLKREDKSEKAKNYLKVIENRSKALKQLTEESISAYYAALKKCGQLDHALHPL